MPKLSAFISRRGRRKCSKSSKIYW